MTDTTNHNTDDDEIDAKVCAMAGISVEEFRKGEAVMTRGSETLKADYLAGRVTTEDAFQQLGREKRTKWARFIRDNMVNRRDTHGLYLGSKQWTEKQPVTEELIKAHVDHEVTIGLHTTSRDNTCRWCCWDFDRHGAEDVGAANLAAAKGLVADLEEKGFLPVLEDSNGAGGYHVWVVFDDEPVNSWDAYAWMRTIPVEGDPERFPKQAKIGKFGNYVRLPGKHPKRDHHSLIWEGADQWALPEDHIWEVSDARLIPETDPPIPEEVLDPAMTNGHAPTGSAAAQYRVASRQGADAEKLLGLICQSRCDSYDEWLKIGMAIHSSDPSDAGLAIWDSWSRNSPKYVSGVCSQKWQTFGGGGGRPVTIGTLRRWASEDNPEGYESIFPKRERKEFQPMQTAKAFLEDEGFLSVRGTPLIRQHADRWYVYDWDAAVYEPEVASNDLEVLVRGYMETVFQSPRAAMVAEVLKALEAAPGVQVRKSPPCWLDGFMGPEDQDCIDLRNGVLNVDTGELIPPDERRFRVCATGYDFDPDAPEPKVFMRFLEDSFGGGGQPDVLAEWAGYCLTGETKYQKFLYLVGQKCSGKGTFLDILESLVGETATCSLDLSSFGERFGLSETIGKRLARDDDARFGEGRRLGSDVVKRMLKFTSGEPLQIDRKHSAVVSVRTTARLAVASNEWPRFDDKSDAIGRRLLLIESRGSHEHSEDYNLFAKIKEEIPGVLNWALAGLARLRRRDRFPERIAPSGDAVTQDIAELRDIVRTKFGGKATVTQVARLAPNKFRTDARGWLVLLIKAGWGRWTTEGGSELELTD